MPNSAPTAYTLDYALFQEMLDLWLQKVGDRLLTVDQVDDKKVFRVRLA